MGPRSFERGNEHAPHCSSNVHPRLQWGRARSSAETFGAGLGARIYYRLQWGRARSTAETYPIVYHSDHQSQASMGPRSFERGNGGSDRHVLYNGCSLQWGRARSSAETALSGVDPQLNVVGFNGAALVRARKRGSCSSSSQTS